MKTFPLSRVMSKSHARIMNKRFAKTKPNIDVYASLRDPTVPLKFKLYRVRRWQGKLINE